MYVIRKRRLNKFTPTQILTPRMLFARLGLSGKSYENKSKLTSDCISDADLGNCSKIQALALADSIVSKSEEFKKNPTGTEPLQRVDPAKL